MIAALRTASLLLTAAALVCGGVALATTRRLSEALAVFLDVLTAAGLLRLAAAPTWRALATSAAIVALRHLGGAGLAAGQRARAVGAAAGVCTRVGSINRWRHRARQGPTGR